MQIKVITVPVFGGEALNEDLNNFLRSKKVVSVEQQLVSGPHGGAWSFCIQYVEDQSPYLKNKERPDYKRLLDEASYQRYLSMRGIRLKVATADGIPAYAVFTDEELAELSKIEVLTATSMKGVKGVGEKKIEKYGVHFLSQSTADEKSQ